MKLAARGSRMRLRGLRVAARVKRNLWGFLPVFVSDLLLDSSTKKMEAMDTFDSLRQIRNFGIVTPALFRGGQPTGADIANLAGCGVQTVVSLRWGNSTILAEQAAVERAGMQFISIPLNCWTLPDSAVLSRFFEIADNSANHPVFLHCLHGADRTGMLVAIYRMKKMGWSFKAAYKEMKDFGYHRFRLRHFQWVVYHHSLRGSPV